MTESLRPTPPDGSLRVGRTPLCDAVQAALAAREIDRDAALAALRAEVCIVVRRMHGDGARPETVLVHIKSEVRTALAGRSLAHWRTDTDDALIAEAAQWCIAEYFRCG
jgi:hypothetical protein